MFPAKWTERLEPEFRDEGRGSVLEEVRAVVSINPEGLLGTCVFFSDLH